MVNPSRGEVALAVNAEVTLTLRFTAGALSSLQEAFGISRDGFREFVARATRPDAAEWVLMFFAATRAHHRAEVPQLSDAATVWSRLQTFEARTAVLKAFGACWPLADATAVPASDPAPFTWDGLLRDGLRAGLSVRSVWELTPREIAETINAAQWRRDLAYRRSIEQAYLTAAWSRSKRLPSLKEVLPPDSHHLTPAERRARANRAFWKVAQAWGAQVTDATGAVVTPERMN